MADSLTLQTLAAELERLRERNDRLAARLDDLEARNERLAELEAENEALRDQNTELERRVAELEDETTRLDAATDAAHKRSGATKQKVAELQARELEKGAHLREPNVDPHEIEVDGDRLEKITKEDDHAYYRLPEADDPLDRGDVTLAHGDLLPIQQLARMDDDMLCSTTNALPTRLAAKLWQARTDPTVGDDPWQTGSKNVREYVKASNLKHWIRRQEPGTSDTYAKKLVSRTIDALLELSHHRLAIRKKAERKNGLQYTERWILLTTDAEIPGDTTDPSPTASDCLETADVPGRG